MPRFISPTNFDPHAEAIDGPTPDPWPVDSRLRDDRVKAVRKPVWENQWDGDRLRPGWVERLAPIELLPEYSRLDVLDGLPRPVRVDSLPVVRESVLPTRHSMYGPMKVFLILGAGFVVAFALVLLGWVLKAVPA